MFSGASWAGHVCLSDSGWASPHNLYLYNLICTTLRRIVPSRPHLQHLEGQIRAETTSRDPHQSEEARRADAPHRTRPAAGGTAVLGPPGRQVLDQGARSNGDPDRRTHPALAGREHLSHIAVPANLGFLTRPAGRSELCNHPFVVASLLSD